MSSSSSTCPSPPSSSRDAAAAPPAKRPRHGLLAGRLKPVFEFREHNIDQVQWTNRTDSEKFSAHADSAHNLYVSDTSQIVCFKRDGVYTPVISGIEPHHIVPNGSADFVVILRKSDKQKLCKVTPDGRIETILESNAPLYGPDICPNGDVVHHPSTSRLERRSPRGDLTASIEGGRGKVISFEANSYLTAGQDGHIYFSSKTCVYRWNSAEKTVECIAGHPKAAGKRDGFGSDARFTHLKRPVLTNGFAYVRESCNRFCRIDLSTFEVETIQLQGVESRAVETYGVTPDGRMMFVIFTAPFRIFTAETSDTLASTFLSDMGGIDWAGGAGGGRVIEFRVGKDNQVLCADGRILEARSVYFRSMLGSGMRETRDDAGPIDLGTDVSPSALQALLHFLYTDHFEPVSPPGRVRDMADEDVLRHAKFALEVHILADRFVLPRLARLSEVFLVEFALRTSLVLRLLASIIEPQRSSLASLESACWDFIENNWKQIISNNEASVRELVEQGHPLAVELLQGATSVVRRPTKRPEEDPTEG